MNEPYSTIHRLSLNIRITLGRIANYNGERKKKRRRRKKKKKQKKRKTTRQPELHTGRRRRASLAHSLRRFLSVAPGYFIDDLRRREKSVSRSPLSSARGSEVERCSIDSCHEAASTPRVGKILSRVSLSCSLFICRLRIELVMSADSAADLRRTA